MQKITLLLILITITLFRAYGQIQVVQAGEASDAHAVLETINAETFAKIIDKKELNTLAARLTSEEFAGRETGTEGQKLAAAFIAAQFQSFGIPPVESLGGYFQSYPITVTYPEGISITAAGKNFSFLKDFYSFRGFGDTVLAKNKILFRGYGIKSDQYNDYTNTASIEGNVLMIMAGEPVNKKGISRITGKEEPSSWTTSWRKKTEEARKYNPAVILIVVRDFNKSARELADFINEPTVSLSSEKKKTTGTPVFYISREMADQLLSSSGKSIASLEKTITKKHNAAEVDCLQPMVFNIKRKQGDIIGENVLGYIQGCEKPEELIVVTAHYDHLGEHNGKVYYGADDNASGTSVVINIAKAFAEAKTSGHCPSRSVLIIAFSGEEKGLLGSDFYTRNPVFPLENTVANLNVDMVGREDDKHAGNPNYIYLIGSDKLSIELHDISEQMNKSYTGLELDYTFNAPDDPNKFYSRSDHYNFARNRVPVIFYFNGVHDDYHKPSDTLDKLDFNKMEKIGRLIFHTAWELANRAERVKLNEKESMNEEN